MGRHAPAPHQPAPHPYQVMASAPPGGPAVPQMHARYYPQVTGAVPAAVEGAMAGATPGQFTYVTHGPLAEVSSSRLHKRLRYAKEI